MAAEVMGIIQGPYGGSSRDLRAGGLSFQSSYTPHGGKMNSSRRPSLCERVTDFGRNLRDIQAGDNCRVETREGWRGFPGYAAV